MCQWIVFDCTFQNEWSNRHLLPPSWEINTCTLSHARTHTPNDYIIHMREREREVGQLSFSSLQAGQLPYVIIPSLSSVSSNPPPIPPQKPYIISLLALLSALHSTQQTRICTSPFLDFWEFKLCCWRLECVDIDMGFSWFAFHCMGI